MKNTIAIVSLMALAGTAFGDSYILLRNAGRPVTLNADPSALYPQDAAWSGKPVPTLNGSGVTLPSGVLLNVALYAGATSGSESLAATIPFDAINSADDGLWGPVNIKLTGLPPLVPTFFDIFVYESSYPNEEAGKLGLYWATTGEFTAVPGRAPLPINGPQSTWAAGPLILSEGPIFTPIPEPGVLGVAGLGAATLLSWRRRKM